MIYIAYIILTFTLIQLLVAVTNTLFLPKLKSGIPVHTPLVSLLIPVRNEEENIGNLLDDIMGQDYENFEVLVFNDQSEDLTAEMVEKYSSIDNRIKLINSDHLPSGWLGKNFACHSLSELARGEYFLFLDADVRIGKGLITHSIVFMERHKTVFLTIFPKQIMGSVGEMLTVPNMNYILLSLLPLIMVRKSAIPAFAAANGQFMMFKATVYRLFEPHREMRYDLVEDISTARYLKKRRQKIACLTGDESIRCRMYKSYNEAVRGFSKNVAAFFGNSLLLAALFWVVTTFGFIFVIFAFPLYIFVLYLAAYIFSRMLISFVSEQNIMKNVLYIIPQQLSCGLFIIRAAINRINRKYQWKGRSIHW